MASTLTRARMAALITHGALLFGGGLVAGLALTFDLLGQVQVWPLPWQWEIDLPGSGRAWLRTHLGLILNGIGIWVFALLAGRLLLSEGRQKLYCLCVLVTGWFNSAGFVIGTLFDVHGLAFGQSPANSVTYLFFLVAVLTAFTQVALVLAGARELRRAPE